MGNRCSSVPLSEPRLFVVAEMNEQTEQTEPNSFIHFSSRCRSVDPTELETFSIACSRSIYASRALSTPTCVIGTCFTRSLSFFMCC